MQPSRFTFVVVMLLAACSPQAEVLFNAPPELDGAWVYVDDHPVGALRASHNFRAGTFATQNEMGAPPRHEANLCLRRLEPGLHRLRIVKDGYAQYKATFVKRSQYLEVYVPDDAAAN